MYVDFRQDGWPLCPLCKEDELYSVLMLKCTSAEHKPTVAQCMRDVMRCYKCGWASDMNPRRTLLGHPYIVVDGVWPPRMVFPNEAENKTGAIEIQGRQFEYAYLGRYDTVFVPIPYGPQVADADLFA